MTQVEAIVAALTPVEDADLLDALKKVLEDKASVVQELVDWAVPDRAYVSSRLLMEENRLEGTIKTFSELNGYGFIECPEVKAAFGNDVFLHGFQAAGCTKGQQVSFAILLNKERKPQAFDVRPPVSMEGKGKKGGKKGGDAAAWGKAGGDAAAWGKGMDAGWGKGAEDPWGKGAAADPWGKGADAAWAKGAAADPYGGWKGAEGWDAKGAYGAKGGFDAWGGDPSWGFDPSWGCDPSWGMDPYGKGMDPYGKGMDPYAKGKGMDPYAGCAKGKGFAAMAMGKGGDKGACGKGKKAGKNPGKEITPDSTVLMEGVTDRRFSGNVKSFNTERGFGFISCEDIGTMFGGDVFLHHKQAEACGGFEVGAAVTFAVFLNKDSKPQAKEVTLAGMEVVEPSAKRVKLT